MFFSNHFIPIVRLGCIFQTFLMVFPTLGSLQVPCYSVGAAWQKFWSFSALKGFWMNPVYSFPAKRSIALHSLNPLIMITFTSDLMRRSSLNVSTPSRWGMVRSFRTSLVPSQISRNRDTASSPSRASSTWNPKDSSIPSTTVHTVSSSSTTRSQGCFSLEFPPAPLCSQAINREI